MSHPIIAFCLEYPLALRGGVSVLVEELIRRLEPHFRIVLVSPDAPEELAAHPLQGRWLAHVPWKPEKVSRSASRELAERLQALGVQLAHFHLGGVYGWGLRVPGQAPFGLLAARGIAVCTTVHLTVSPLDGYCGPQKPWWFKLALFPGAWLAKLAALAAVRAEVAVSRHDWTKLRRWYAPFAGRYRMIYHSRLDLADVPPPAAVRQPVVLNVGHLAARKGQLILAQAFAEIAARHPAWQLQLAGSDDDGTTGGLIRDLAQRAGLRDRIHVLGSRNDALELMAHCGVYVQPSLEEALGLALQEALYLGCPALGTTAGGIPELIADGDNGLLVPKGNGAALAQALDRLLGDAALRERLAARARPAMAERKMTASGMADQYRALYVDLLAQPPQLAA